MSSYHNTLYVTTPGAYLAKDHENVAVRVDHQTKLAVPMHHLGGVVCFGPVSASPELIGKVANARSLLVRSAREQPDPPVALNEAATRLAERLVDLGREDLTTESSRGHEGEAAAGYFAAFHAMIRSPDPAFRIALRSRRPPLDAINALLSFVYALVRHDCVSALAAVGLDPAVGYLHADRPGRPSLALDLMEEFRPALADRLVLALINRGQVSPKGFLRDEAGGVSMDSETRRPVLVAYQEGSKPS